jgi:hypothetical protein
MVMGSIYALQSWKSLEDRGLVSVLTDMPCAVAEIVSDVIKTVRFPFGHLDVVRHSARVAHGDGAFEYFEGWITFSDKEAMASYITLC